MRGMYAPMEKAIQLPELLNIIGTHLSQHELAQCVRVSRHWHDLFTPHLWRHLSIEAIARINFNYTFAGEICAQYSQHIRSLELENTNLIDNHGLAFSNLTHLQYDERMDDNLQFQHQPGDPNPTWTEAEQWSLLALIKCNRSLRSIELTLRHPADPIRIGEVLRELPCLETLELDGPDFEHEGVFWQLLKTCPVLKSATFRNWSQNRLSMDPGHTQPQDISNVIKVRHLSISGCGSVLSLAHSFPALESLDIYQISDHNAQDLEALLAKGHAPKLHRLHVIGKTIHLDKILQHAPPLEYFALSNGSLISGNIGPQIHHVGAHIFNFAATFAPPQAVFANILQSILTVHAHSLKEFVFTLNMPFKDRAGLLMKVLASCPSLVRFYCMVPMDLAKFLEVKVEAPRLEELSLSLVLSVAFSQSDEENLQWEEEFLDRLAQYSELRRLEMTERGAAGYDPEDKAMPLDRAKAVDALSKMKRLDFISLYSHEYAFDGSEWKYNKRWGAR
ncbi:hypothetical protein BGZ59_000390 [Podila verticillata]|nr:hypothetical protein BGZ59_000390 [Podila verticillata]